MTRTTARTLAALAAAGLLAVTGCGDGSDDADAAGAGTTAATTTATPTTAVPSTPAATRTVVVPTPEGLTIPVTIADGTIKPLGKKYDATVGEPIILEVTSDTDDELHLHADPEQSFDVTPGTHTFSFTVEVPGSVTLESHHVGGTIATIDVRP